MDHHQHDRHDEIEVLSWTDLARLPDAMDELADQAGQIVRHARTWVCRTSGFTPSPVCVLRPLAPVMEQLSEAFDDLGRDLDREVRHLRDAVSTARHELATSDVDAQWAVETICLPEVA